MGCEQSTQSWAEGKLPEAGENHQQVGADCPGKLCVSPRSQRLGVKISLVQLPAYGLAVECRFSDIFGGMNPAEEVPSSKFKV